MKIETPFEHLQPVETKRASEIIYDQIRDLILNGELKPGDRLPSERSMMERMHRSRPTVREALRMLERDGFIRTIAGSQGAVVQKLGTRNAEQSLQDLLKTKQITVAQLSEMRSATDVSTARWAAERRTDSDLRRLYELLDEQWCCADDSERLVQLDTAFHVALGDAAKNNVAVIITRVFSNLIESILYERLRDVSAERRLVMTKRILTKHQAIVDAIRDRNAEEAARQMEAHMAAFHEDMM